MFLKNSNSKNENELKISREEILMDETARNPFSRLEHRFSISDLEEIRDAFDVFNCKIKKNSFINLIIFKAENSKHKNGFKFNKNEFSQFLSKTVHKGSKEEVVMFSFERKHLF